ncbi:signal peptidase I [Cellulomonas xiejunii]|uniref:Signal peptidase I n=1 Tax=Cellulomonas xiejunii TaxID=2968083 RepID=A0ABY5KP59_9CELL|nr:signal peptidase I [Cellulomonas xiejunii]MCC2321075.1 signal peptidase I [Cellulomonas xiejunii]UUI71668.1 signal peptidase I [Cellulomonas xiejunii]
MTTDQVPAAVPTAGTAPVDAPRGARDVGSVLLTAAMVVLLLLAAVVTVVPRLIGAVPLTVLSGSMEPTISAGDLVVVRPTDPADLRIGDVVTVQPVSDDPTLVTHRIIGVTHGSDGIAGFVTQGDANEHPDEPVVPEQVMGRVVYTVPLVGHVTHGTWGPYVATAVGVGLVVYGVVTFALPRRDRDEVPGAARP